MNCLEFRRLKASTPRALTAAAGEHQELCRACAEYARSVDETDAQVEAVLRVPVEANLASRVMLNHDLARGRRQRRLVLATAALLVLGVAAFFGYRSLAPAPEILQASVEHVLHEPHALNSNREFGAAQTESAFAASGAKVTGNLQGVLVYLRDCPVPGGIGKHMVLRTRHGAVSVFTMPNMPTRWHTRASHAGYRVAVLPAKRGSVAVVAASADALRACEEILRQRVNLRG